MNRLEAIYKRLINDGHLPSEILFGEMSKEGNYFLAMLGLTEEEHFQLKDLAEKDMVVVEEVVEDNKYICAFSSYELDGREISFAHRPVLFDDITTSILELNDKFTLAIKHSDLIAGENVEISDLYVREIGVSFLQTIGVEDYKNLIPASADYVRFAISHENSIANGIIVFSIFTLKNDGQGIDL